MDNLKAILTLAAVILGILGLLVVIGLVQYLLLFAVLGLACVAAVRFLIKRTPPQIDAPQPKRELRKVERALEEYKRKLK